MLAIAMQSRRRLTLWFAGQSESKTKRRIRKEARQDDRASAGAPEGGICLSCGVVWMDLDMIRPEAIDHRSAWAFR
jgi:hypothetical protein